MQEDEVVVEHFNSEDRIHLRGGQSVPVLTLAVVVCLTAQFAKANFSEEIKTAKEYVVQTVVPASFAALTQE